MFELFVRNLPYSASESDLDQFLQEMEVTPASVKIVQDRETGQSRGFGFVQVEDKHQFLKAINLDGEPFMGRPIGIRASEPRKSQGQEGPRRGKGGNGERGNRGQRERYHDDSD